MENVYSFSNPTDKGDWEDKLKRRYGKVEEGKFTGTSCPGNSNKSCTT